MLSGYVELTKRRPEGRRFWLHHKEYSYAAMGHIPPNAS